MEIIVVLVLVLVNGFFSLSEMAIVSSRRARLQQRASEGHKGAALALATVKDPTVFLSTVQIVITLVGTIAGAFGGATVAKDLAAVLAKAGLGADTAESLAFGLVVMMTTFLSVVLGELVPKSLALSRPEAIAGIVSYPMRFFSFLFLPLVRLLSGATHLVLAVFGVKENNDPQVTEEEVKVLIAQGAETGVFDRREKQMFDGVLYLGDKRVTMFMTPRPEIAYIDANEPPEAQLEALILASSFDYLPLVDGDLDQIVGVIPVKAVLTALARGTFERLSEYVESSLFVPESLAALELFTRLRAEGKDIAVIIDEYGGVTGLVTFADLARAILGSAPSFAGSSDPEVVERSDGSFLVDGSLSIDEFRSRFKLPSQDLDRGIETAAGYALYHLDRIPRAGDFFERDGWRVEIVDMDGNRIDKLLLARLPEDPSI